MNSSREFVSFLLHSSNGTYHIANPEIAGILFSALIVSETASPLLRAIQERWNFFHQMISENLEKAAPPTNYLIPYHILRIVGSPISALFLDSSYQAARPSYPRLYFPSHHALSLEDLDG